MHPTYLYVVPMFHCNGWGHAWMMAILAGAVVCCRKIAPEVIYPLLHEHKITHFGGAPYRLSMLVNAPDGVIQKPDWTVHAMTAGAPPPRAILEKIEKLGFNVTQVYGLTETYGHLTHCAWHEEWDRLDFGERATIKARQRYALPLPDLLKFWIRKPASLSRQMARHWAECVSALIAL